MPSVKPNPLAKFHSMRGLSTLFVLRLLLILLPWHQFVHLNSYYDNRYMSNPSVLQLFTCLRCIDWGIRSNSITATASQLHHSEIASLKSRRSSKEDGESEMNDSDRSYLRRAYCLASRAAGRTRPNPCVGCVLVDFTNSSSSSSNENKDCNGIQGQQRGGERVVGEGWHHRSGEPHAEVIALRHAASAATSTAATSSPMVTGASVEAAAQSVELAAYVSLEPCSHYGRTPPCTLALLERGVVRVVAAMVDPDPRVAGRGLAQLQQHGVDVLLAPADSVEAAACRRLNAPFVHRVLHPSHQPFVAVLCTTAKSDSTGSDTAGTASLTAALANRQLMHRAYQLLQSAVGDIDAVLLSKEQLLSLVSATDAAGRSCFQELFPDHISVIISSVGTDDSVVATTSLTTNGDGVDDDDRGDFKEIVDAIYNLESRVTSATKAASGASVISSRTIGSSTSRQWLIVSQSPVSTEVDASVAETSEVDHLNPLLPQSLLGRVRLLQQHLVTTTSSSSSNNSSSNNSSGESRLHRLLEVAGRLLGLNSILLWAQTAAALRFYESSGALQRLILLSATDDSAVKMDTQSLTAHHSRLYAAAAADSEVEETTTAADDVFGDDEWDRLALAWATTEELTLPNCKLQRRIDAMRGLIQRIEVTADSTVLKTSSGSSEKDWCRRLLSSFLSGDEAATGAAALPPLGRYTTLCSSSNKNSSRIEGDSNSSWSIYRTDLWCQPNSVRQQQEDE